MLKFVFIKKHLYFHGNIYKMVAIIKFFIKKANKKHEIYFLNI